MSLNVLAYKISAAGFAGIVGFTLTIATGGIPGAVAGVFAGWMIGHLSSHVMETNEQALENHSKELEIRLKLENRNDRKLDIANSYHQRSSVELSNEIKEITTDKESLKALKDRKFSSSTYDEELEANIRKLESKIGIKEMKYEKRRIENANLLSIIQSIDTSENLQNFSSSSWNGIVGGSTFFIIIGVVLFVSNFLNNLIKRLEK